MYCVYFTFAIKILTCRPWHSYANTRTRLQRRKQSEKSRLNRTPNRECPDGRHPTPVIPRAVKRTPAAKAAKHNESGGGQRSRATSNARGSSRLRLCAVIRTYVATHKHVLRLYTQGSRHCSDSGHDHIHIRVVSDNLFFLLFCFNT